MPDLITTCSQCHSSFRWNSDYCQDMPDCPKCGYNPDKQFKAADVAALVVKLKNGDRYARQAAAAELGDRGDRQAVEPLIAALADQAAVLPAVIALRKLGDPRAAEPLIRVMAALRNRSGSPAVAFSEVAIALATIGTEDAVSAVMSELASVDCGSAVSCAREVIDVLMRRGEASVDVLIAALKHEKSCVREEAVRALGRMGATCAVEPLLALLKDSVRQDAARALGQIGAKGGVVPVEPLLALLKDSDNRVVRSAAEALISLGWKPVEIRDKVAFFTIAENWGALKALGQVAVDHLRDTLLQGKTWKGRIRAAEGLSRIGWEPAGSQEQTAYALARGEIEKLSPTDPATCDAMTAALADARYPHRSKLPEALGKSGNVRTVEPLMAVLKMDDESLGYRAAEGLGNLGDRRAVSSHNQVICQ